MDSRISKLPPLMPCCYWCGHDILSEPIITEKTDTELPVKRITVNYDFCSKCNEIIGDNIKIIGVVDEQPIFNMPPISTDNNTGKTLYPGGSMFVASEDWVKSFIYDDEDPSEEEKEYYDKVFNSVIKDRALMISEDLCKEIIHTIKESDLDIDDISKDMPELQENDTNENT